MMYGIGHRYTGEWQDDMRHGDGTFSYANGSMYMGAYKQNAMHGQGTFGDARGGWCYSGALEQHRPTTGLLTQANGRRFAVTFDCDCSPMDQGPVCATMNVRADAVLELTCARDSGTPRARVLRLMRALPLPPPQTPSP